MIFFCIKECKNYFLVKIWLLKAYYVEFIVEDFTKIELKDIQYYCPKQFTTVTVLIGRILKIVTIHTDSFYLFFYRSKNWCELMMPGHHRPCSFRR